MSRTPFARFRRLRKTPELRKLFTETTLSKSDLIQPIFLVSGSNIENPLTSLPGESQFSVDRAVEQAKRYRDLGIVAVLLFGIPEEKDEIGSSSWDSNGIIQRAVREIKREVPDIVVITDLCFCEYTSHGHCGVLDNGDVDNDKTLANLVQQGLSHAECGADIIAPSGMIDGMVQALRQGFDEGGYKELPIMSYAAKFASASYGPFREAADCAPSEGDRKSYQMNPANADEALREAAADVAEGADIIMVKPAGLYLDVIQRIKNELNMPTAAYQVSGEYAMIQAAAANGWIDGESVMLESLLSIKRAGADTIISYFSKDVALLLES